MLTRQTFGAFDQEVWIDQWILNALGYGPIKNDGLWGNETFGAVSDFRQMNDLGPASGTTKAGAIDQAFKVALWGQVLEQGLTPPSPPGGGAAAGGTGTTPVVTGGGGGGSSGGVPVSTPSTPTTDTTGLLALAAVGIGAVILFGGKKGRR